MTIGGGRFFLSTGADTAAAAGTGACRMATGSGSLAVAAATTGSATASCRALKFLFFRRGVAIAMLAAG